MNDTIAAIISKAEHIQGDIYTLSKDVHPDNKPIFEDSRKIMEDFIRINIPLMEKATL